MQIKSVKCQIDNKSLSKGLEKAKNAFAKIVVVQRRRSHRKYFGRKIGSEKNKNSE
jgi:hypothetical protein